MRAEVKAQPSVAEAGGADDETEDEGGALRRVVATGDLRVKAKGRTKEQEQRDGKNDAWFSQHTGLRKSLISG